jgi:hypothetical protein
MLIEDLAVAGFRLRSLRQLPGASYHRVRLNRGTLGR